MNRRMTTNKAGSHFRTSSIPQRQLLAIVGVAIVVGASVLAGVAVAGGTSDVPDIGSGFVEAAAAWGTPENPEVIYIDAPHVPVAFPWGQPAGYLWSEREGQGHVMFSASKDAADATLVIPGGSSTVAVEVTGLPLGSSDSISIYSLEGIAPDGTEYRFKNPVGRDGKAVFWGVPPVPMALVLRDPSRAEIKTISLVENPVGPTVKNLTAAMDFTVTSRCEFHGDYGSCDFRCNAGDYIRLEAYTEDHNSGHVIAAHVNCGDIEQSCYRHDWSCTKTVGPTKRGGDGLCYSGGIKTWGICTAYGEREPNERDPAQGAQARRPTNPNPPTPGGGDPYPSYYDQTTGETINQAVISSNVHGKVSTTACYDHGILVSAKASGGIAASGYAETGGSFSYTATECESVESGPDGWGTRSIRNDEFEKAVYDDGSYSVYLKSRGPNTRIVPWYVQVVCAGGGTACFVNSVELDACRTWGKEISEQTAGTAFIGGGWKTPAWNVEGQLQVSTGSDTRIRYQITAPDCGTHQWYWGALGGDQAKSGLIGYLRHA